MECKLPQKNSDKNNRYNNTVDVNSVSHVGGCHAVTTFATGCFAVFMLILFASNIYLHVKYIHVSTELARHLQKIENLSSTSGTQSKFDIKQEFSNLSELVHSQLRNHEKHRYTNKRRHWRKDLRSVADSRTTTSLREEIQRIKHQLIPKPIVHLPAATGEANENHCTSFPREGACTGCGCFSWGLPNDYYVPNFNYTIDYSKSSGIVRAIEILTPGFYLIYSQIAINGPRQRSIVPSVGYETVKVSRNNAVTILMKSYITQDQRGREYRGPTSTRDSHGNYPYPFDTLNQMGIFNLNCNDKIMVRATHQTGTNVRFRADEDKSYFGIVMINFNSDFIKYRDFSCSQE